MITSTPAISVLMPVCNAGRFLAPAVESVLAQTFSDFELIAIDDGSSDESGKVLANFAARDPRIRLFSHGNQGIVATLNRALELARAPLVARMDADDICRPDRFGKQVAYMQHHPEIAAVSGAMDVIDESDTYLRTDAFPTLPDAIDSELLHRSCVCHPAVMARTAVLRSLGGYRRNVQYAEDYDLWLRMSEVGRIANLPDVLLSHRVHPSKTSERQFIAQELAVLAARGAARQRRRGRADPLALSETRSPLGYGALQRMFEDATPRAEFALAFFSTVLGKAAQQGSITQWSRLYLRHGLWDLDRNAAATMILLLGHVMLRRRRAGAPPGELARFLFWAMVTAVCHPLGALRAIVQAKSRFLTRDGTRRSERPAKSAASA
jgi:glycosyltransferase involved in cell wall biosynthesis